MNRVVCLVASIVCLQAPAQERGQTFLVGHRGLIHQAPENTLSNFAACLHLRLGFELDIQRTKDGRLVCIHDDDVVRTTNDRGKVADLTLDELRRLDAGGWFDPAFAGERIPLLEEVFALLQQHLLAQVLVALDFKVEGVEAEVVQLAKKYGVLRRVVCIGRTITEPNVRKKLREADAKTPIAVLAAAEKDVDALLTMKEADWVYVRFVPSGEVVRRIHEAGKRVFLAGPTVSGVESENWRAASRAGVDAILTDFPLECRAELRKK